MPLDPDIQRFVDEVGAAWARHGDLSKATPEAARRAAREVRAPWRSGGPRMHDIAEKIIDADPPALVRFYDPDPQRSKPIFIYLHGGGWSLFDIDTHDRVMREYAARAGVIVAGVDYALAPEDRFPVAVEQVVSVVDTIAGQSVGAIAIGGDSAGANLAIAACMRLRDMRRSPVRAMVLNYGVFTRHSSSEAVRQFGGEGQMLTAGEMDRFWRNYLSNESEAENPLACPLNGDLRRLPPAFLVVPEYDLLGEQSTALADRLRAAGVPVECHVYQGATHSFLEAVSIAPLAARAFDDTAQWLRTTLGE